MPPLNFEVYVMVEPDDDGFHVYCPALKGLHVAGATEEEALQNARDAVLAYIRSLMKHGDPIPLGILPQDAVPSEAHHGRHAEKLAIATT